MIHMINLASGIAQSPDVRRAFTIGEPSRLTCESRFCVNRSEPVYLSTGGMALCGICRRLWHRLMVRKAVEIRRGDTVRLRAPAGGRVKTERVA